MAVLKVSWCGIIGGPSLLDGSVSHGYWFFAVGSNQAWGGGIPGGAGGAESQVEVWAQGC
jgi:hypothetical protein